MNELPTELVIEIFEKINLKDYKLFIKFSKINKRFNSVYKKYFEELVKLSNPKSHIKSELYIPLLFWCSPSRRSLPVLPLVNLNYHEIIYN